ncbi:M28 family peptidase [Cohnella faecalis]|uniref:Peptidase M28 domain-containing protein n=1 Tax=Cohnella faecalis TaxID=2315694 RepID=A0A398CNY6_9BACL|nr:M28 family peptidase [Cohnella faecalis]RIE02999.1 hypothetical protein D3H35_20575 [Cohnella faecalis]
MNFMEKKTKFRGTAILAYAASILAVMIAVTASAPSVKVARKDAPAAEFSAERVYEHLQMFAQQPRHPGTAYHEQAKTYILDTIRGMDVPVEVESSVVTHEKKELPIHNIVAKLEGTEAGKEIVLMAHYDSVEEGPGVNDDAVNVGVLLETMRLLKQEKPLKNPVTFLLTDGEETGLYGAKAYVKKHSTDRIAVVVNLEARGYKGPIVLFETIGPNGRAIQLFDEHVDHPYAFSFLADLYRILPHDTDMTVFKQSGGVIGLNLAYMEGAQVYHTAKDDLQHVHLPTVQNSGLHAAALAKALGSSDLSALGNEGNRVYFNLFGHVLVQYPVSWNYAFGAIAFLLGALVMAIGIKKKTVQPRKSVRWALFVACCAVLLLTFGTIYSIGIAVYEFNGLSAALLMYTAVAALLSAAVVWILKKFKVFYRMRKLVHGLTYLDISVGALLVMAVLTAWTTIALPGSQYLTALPLALCSLNLLGYFLFRRWLTASFSFSLSIGAAFTLLLFPAIQLLTIGFGIAGIHYLLIALLLYVPLVWPPFLNENFDVSSNAEHGYPEMRITNQ